MPPGSTTKSDKRLVVGNDGLIHEAHVERHAAVYAVRSWPRRVAAALNGKGTVVEATTRTFGESLHREGDAFRGERTEDTGGWQLSAGRPAFTPQLILIVTGVDDLVGVFLTDLVTLDVEISVKVACK